MENQFCLVKSSWTVADCAPFEAYLATLSKGADKALWEQRILNTSLPCLAIGSVATMQVAKEIAKGNFRSFLDLKLYRNYAEVAINAALLTKIKDFAEFKLRLRPYLAVAECWATTDCVKLAVKPSNVADYAKLAADYFTCEKPFERRFGLGIMLKLAAYPDFAQVAFSMLDSLSNETEYYVNMMGAWVLAELFTKQREATLSYFPQAKTNDFVINKGISKCRDSFRVSQEDKDFLLRFKRKTR